MAGLSSSGKERVRAAVERMFDEMALSLLGSLPSLRGKGKALVVSSGRPAWTLAHLFLQAMGGLRPNEVEQDALRGTLESARGYIEAVRAKTQSAVAEGLDAYLKESAALGTAPTEDGVREVFRREAEAARRKIEAVTAYEATRARNAGSAVGISRAAAAAGESDPVVFFVVVRDGKACAECTRLHLMGDGVTPRLWRLSELGHGYHKRGDESPKVGGLHPGCRCPLTYLARGYGFKGGRVAYVGDGHDELAAQRSRS